MAFKVCPASSIRPHLLRLALCLKSPQAYMCACVTLIMRNLNFMFKFPNSTSLYGLAQMWLVYHVEMIELSYETVFLGL